MMTSQARRAPTAPADLVFEVCREFIRGKSASEIAKEVRASKRGRLSREQIYPYLIEGAHRGYFVLRPPLEREIRERLLRTYRLDPAEILDVDPLHVVNVNGPADLVREQVNSKAAEIALLLIERIARRKKRGERVHVGLGSGRTTMMVAQKLAELMRNEPARVPQLCLHAISSGFSVTDPQNACVSFLGYFDRIVETKFVGLFAPTFASANQRDYNSVRALPGVAEAVERSGDIDLVITSLASAHDDHGELRKFIRHTSGVVKTSDGALKPAKPQSEKTRREFEAALRRKGWVGDVQYRPYSAHAPIEVEKGFRAVTLFELPELVKLARSPGKAVLLVAGPCGECANTRSPALVPLLDNRSLKVWSHLVTDVRTAKEADESAPPRHEGAARQVD